jgi:hypothetical protein
MSRRPCHTIDMSLSPLVVFLRSHRRAVLVALAVVAAVGIAVSIFATPCEQAPPAQRIEPVAIEIADDDPMPDIEQSSYDSAPPGGLPIFGRVVKVNASYHCGVMIGVSQVLYTSPFDDDARFAIAVPCLEFSQHAISFAVGELHALDVDAKRRVREIRWNDRRHRLASSGLPAVVMPAEGFGRLGWRYDGTMSYDAGAWSWP